MGVNMGESLDPGINGIDDRQFGAGVESFDPNAVEDQVMQDYKMDCRTCSSEGDVSPTDSIL